MIQDDKCADVHLAQMYKIIITIIITIYYLSFSRKFTYECP